MEKLNKKKIKLRNNEELAYVEVGEGNKTDWGLTPFSVK